MKKKGIENKKNHIEMSNESLSFNELFPRFVAPKIAEGVSENTVDNYHQHWKCIGKHIDLDKSIGEVISIAGIASHLC